MGSARLNRIRQEPAGSPIQRPSPKSLSEIREGLVGGRSPGLHPGQQQFGVPVRCRMGIDPVGAERARLTFIREFHLD